MIEVWERVSTCHSPSLPSKGRENPKEAKVILIPFTILMFIIPAWSRTLSHRSPEKLGNNPTRTGLPEGVTAKQARPRYLRWLQESTGPFLMRSV